jgi:glycosyltransferase involved in cell wall biosynthesis
LNNKVAFLINSLTNGGAERVVSNIVSTLKADGYEVELICLEKDDFYIVDKNVKVTYLSQFDGKENTIKKLLMLIALAFRLKTYVKDNDIRIVQSHLFRANYVNSLAKILGSNHLVQLMSTVSATSKYSKNNLASKSNLFLINKLYKYADLLIFKAKAMQYDFVNNFDLTNKNIVINNPIDIDKINQLKDDSTSSIFNFDKNKKYIVSMGRFHKQKRQKDLIDSFSAISKKYDDLEVIFLGDGEEKKEILKYVKEMKVDDKIHFLGNVKNPYYYLNNSYLYISTSSSEGFPNALVEAMCCNIPVVSTDCMTGPREILAPETDFSKTLDKGMEKYSLGILVAVGDIDSLSKAIDIMMDKKSYIGYQSSLKNRVDDFAFKKILDKYKTILGLDR